MKKLFVISALFVMVFLAPASAQLIDGNFFVDSDMGNHVDAHRIGQCFDIASGGGITIQAVEYFPGTWTTRYLFNVTAGGGTAELLETNNNIVGRFLPEGNYCIAVGSEGSSYTGRQKSGLGTAYAPLVWTDYADVTWVGRGQFSSNTVFVGYSTSVWADVANITYSPYLLMASSVNLVVPLNDTSATTSTIFNASVIPINSNVTNATIYVWDSDSVLFNETTNVVTGNTTNWTTWTIANIVPGNYKWNVYGCVQNYTGDSLCKFTNENRTFFGGLSDVTTAFNETLYQTVEGSYNVTFNVSSGTPTATLYWNGTGYPGTGTNVAGNNWRFEKLFTPASTELLGTKSLIWSIITGGVNYNATTETQTYATANLTACGAAPQNVPFINFTFLDETTLTAVNAFVDASTWNYWLGSGSIYNTLNYGQTATALPSHAFCFSPSTETLTTDLEFKYSNTTYPQRTYTLDDQALTSTVTNKVLYLLGSGDGIYSSFSVVDTGGGTISGATVLVERSINSVYVTVGQSTTGSDGVSTFWVNPNFAHRITVSKTGYINTQVTVTPSQSIYTVTMSSNQGNSSYAAPIPGITYSVRPGGGTIDVGSTNFNLTVNALDADLENCKLELLEVANKSNVLSSVTGITNSSYCFISMDYTVSADDKIFGRVSIDTTGSTGFFILNADFKWIVIDIDRKAWRGITSFFSDLSSIQEFGSGNEGEFARVVMFFFIITLLAAVLMYTTGAELSNPGMVIGLLWVVVLIASIGGFLTIEMASGNIVTEVMSKYAFIFIFGMLAGGYYLNNWRRISE